MIEKDISERGNGRMPQALFYPSIGIRDEAFLKTSLLYWDSIRTIVPESIEAPYSSKTERVLNEMGYLIPLRVNPDMEEVNQLSEDVLGYLYSPEGVHLLGADRGGNGCDRHGGKLAHRRGRDAYMHSEKLPHRVRDLFASRSMQGGNWVETDEGFRNFYMTLLASRLSERIGAQLLTSFPDADSFAITARLDALVPVDSDVALRRAREYEAFGPRRLMPKRLASGMLAHLTIERTVIDAGTPIDQIVAFRGRYHDEIGRFRAKVEELAATVDSELPEEALRKHVTDLYRNEVQPAIANLRAALNGRRIQWICDGLLKIGFLTASSSTMLVAAGLPVPTALLVGAGISLAVSRTMFNVDRRKLLSDNPYSYLYYIEKELA